MLYPHNMPVRISASAEVNPVEEYDATVDFQGWETESGTPDDTDGWSIDVFDRYHGVTVSVMFTSADNTVTTALRRNKN